MNHIPLFRPSYGRAELDALREPFESGWIGLGPKTAEFERQFAEYVGAEHAVATNSATAALHLALLGLHVSGINEVLVPAITFVSTAHAVVYCGARPVFVDVEPDTLCIDVDDCERKITPRTAAIVPVHYGGHACRMDELWQLADRERLIVVEDAAHACGSEYRGRRIGGLDSHATCFSFHAVKNLATGDGGMITTDDAHLADKLRRLRWCGIDKSTWQRTGETRRGDRQYGWYYEVTDLGYKAHMNDIAAALGLVQLSRLDALNARRRMIVGQYNAAFAGLEWLERPVEHGYTRSALHNYVIKTDHRDALNLWLKERRIDSGVHYMPLHLHPYYTVTHREQLPVAERVWRRLLTLPLYPDMTDGDVARVIEAVTDFGRRAL